MIDTGQVKTQAELARIKGSSRARVTQILNLLKLDSCLFKRGKHWEAKGIPAPASLRHHRLPCQRSWPTARLYLTHRVLLDQTSVAGNPCMVQTRGFLN